MLKIQEEMEAPVKLSEVEKEKFNTTFEALKDWLDDGKDVMLEKDRDEAYRYVNLLISHLQMVDVDFIAGASKATPVIQPSPARQDRSGNEVVQEPHNIKSVPVTRPTVAQVDRWLETMNPQIRAKVARLLDCFKQYLDPDSEVGADVICTHCNPEEIAKCIRIADPSIKDSMTVFMEHQLR